METTDRKILIVEPADYSRQALDVFAAAGTLLLFPEMELPIASAINEVHTLVVRLQYKWDSELLSKASQLRCIVTPTTGLDHIDLAYCRSNHIQVISLQGETGFLSGIPSTAELSFGLLLALLRHIPAANNHVLSGNWNRNLFKGNNLAGKQLGIIGLGRVGKQVAGYAKAFGMQVAAYDPFIESWPTEVQRFYEPAALLANCDMISIHIPSPGNDDFISANLLSNIKEGAVMINTSRGSVWNEQAVAGLLQQGRIKGVATDVLQNELEEKLRLQSPLLQMQRQGYNIIITPHIAGATYESMHATENFVAEKWRLQFDRP